MGAPTGNKFWEIRSSHGRKPLFDNPDRLWSAAVEYFEWNEENPLYESRLVSFQGESKLEQVPLMRAMTIEGLCLFLDIDQQTLKNYEDKEDFFGVVHKIRNVIKKQKFEGASAGLLNSNIIARDLGLRDNQSIEQDVNHSGKIDNKWTVEFVNADSDKVNKDSQK